MSWVSGSAVFFIIWWTVLFAMLPLGLRTQEENDDVTLGTIPSAPHGPHMHRALIRTTIGAVLIFGSLLLLSRWLGYSLDDIPRIMPEF